MKMNLPLPKTEKKLAWTKDFEQKLGCPFYSAKHWKTSFTESDVKYIEGVIKSHKLYRTIYKQGIESKTLNAVEQIRRYETEIEFLTAFMNDVKCPKNLNNFLYLYIGNLSAQIKEQGWQKQQFVRNSFFMDRWFETCH